MPEKFILISVEEGLGNGIEASPLIAQIKAEHPDIIIDMLTSGRAYPVFKNNPHVRKVYLPTDKIEGRYDIGFNTCFRTGVFDEPIKACSDKFIFEPQPSWCNKSELLVNLETAMKAELISRTDVFYPTEFVTDVKYKKTKRVVFHVGCVNSPHWMKRRWANIYWIELMNLCRNYLKGYKLIIVAGEGELEDSNLISSETDVDVFTGSLEEVAGLLKASSLLVSIDSGIMHLGTTTGIKQIALFGCTSEIKSKPQAKEGVVKIIRKDISCQRCYINNKQLFTTCRENLCMQQIAPSLVFEEIGRMLDYGKSKS